MQEKYIKKIKLIITLLIFAGLVWLLIVSPMLKFHENEKTLEKAARRYYELNNDKLPTGERVKTLSLNALYKESYLKNDLYAPYSGKVCSLDNSWVKVKRVNGEYNYYTYLDCGLLKSSIDHKGPTIKLNGDTEMVLDVGDKYNEQGEYCSMEYIDKMGKPALSQDFALCKPFKEGIASVVYDSETYYKGEPSWFFINKAGKDLFGTLYEMTGVFGDGMCSVMKDSVNGIGYINSNGELVIPYKYIYARTFENGFAVVGTKASGAKYAIINKKGEVISDYKFRPQYLSSSQIIDAIKNEINSQNYLTSFEMCKECEKIGVNDYINSYIANTLGRHFYHGWAVSKDLELANNYFRKAIELKQNHSASVNSYNYLGIICEEKKDFASAVRYYNLCIEKDKDYYPALYNLGMLYYYGHGVAQDYKMALSYFERCAKLGNKRNAEKMMEIANWHNIRQRSTQV